MDFHESSSPQQIHHFPQKRDIKSRWEALLETHTFSRLQQLLPHVQGLAGAQGQSFAHGPLQTDGGWVWWVRACTVGAAAGLAKWTGGWVCRWRGTWRNPSTGVHHVHGPHSHRWPPVRQDHVGFSGRHRCHWPLRPGYTVAQTSSPSPDWRA